MPNGEGVLLHLTTKRYLSINATGVCVWQALQEGPTSTTTLVETVVKRFAVETDQARTDVLAFLHHLEQESVARPLAD